MRRLRAALPPLALAAATAAFFWPILDNGFVNWDDPGNIVDNPWLGRFDPAGIAWAFRSTLYGHFQPLSWLSLSLDKALWGLDPSGFHLTSLLLHAASAALLFLFLRRLLGGEDAVLPAAAATALFSWHPLRVESVAWATERRDQLVLFFLLVSSWLYVRAIEKDEREPDLRLPLAAFGAALMSKVFAVVFPFLLLALDAGALKRTLPGRRLLAEKAGFWLAAAAALALGVRAQWLAGAAPGLAQSGWTDRAAILAWTPGWTARKTFLPARLSPFVFVAWRAEPWRFWPMAAFTAVLAGVWLAMRRDRGLFWTGAAWIIALSPALGLFKSGPQTSADRFTLLPALVLSVGTAFWLRRLGRKASIAALALAALLGLLARSQALVWRDSVALWTRAADVGPANPLTVGNLASALRAVGREGEAEVLYRALAEADPDNPAALAVAGDAHYQVGDWTGAESLYAKALARNLDLPSVRVNRGLALYRLGRVPEAADEFAAAADAAPGSSDAWHNLGIALARMGRYADADRCLSRALRLDPARADSRRARAELRPLLSGEK